MSLVAACQSRQWLLARRIAGCLVSVDGIGAVIAAASGFADIMRRHLPELRLRLTGDAPANRVALPESGRRLSAGAAAPADITIH